MFNLLPQQDQRDLVSDYRLRFAVVSLVLFSLLGTVALIALIPSFIVSYQKEILTKNNITLLEKEIAWRAKDRHFETLTFATKEIEALEVTNPVAYTYEIVADIINSKTEAIKIVGIQITTDDGGKRDINVIGQAGDRDALLSFVRILEQEKSFDEVTTPISNFAAASNINFSIIIKTK